MAKKIHLLITASILGLIALSVIQGYLVNNTYKLKKDAFITDTRRSISRMDDTSPVLDSINDIWQDAFLELMIDFRHGRVGKDTIIGTLKQSTSSLNESYRSAYKAELDKKDIAFPLQFQKRVRAIILSDSTRVDTLFYKSDAQPSFHLVGDYFEPSEAHKISNAFWLTDHGYQEEVDGKQQDFTYYLQFETEDMMNIDGWKEIVLKQMAGLFVGAIAIFLFVFGSLFYSIKNLITQKKIADIKTDFVNNITHELKTPLATLSLATKMIRTDEFFSKPEALESTIQTIDRQNVRLQKLIDQVMHNSMGYNEINLQLEQVNTQLYFGQLLDDFELSHQNKIVVKRSLEANELQLDKFFIATALLNILDNAFKYGARNILCTTKVLDHKGLSITIADDGIGISAKHRKDIFEKFFRVGNKEVHDVKGLGLGLYYTRQIILAHQGSIELESTVNKGSTFTITIPNHS